jgi:hypothetical protein
MGAEYATDLGLAAARVIITGGVCSIGRGITGLRARGRPYSLAYADGAWPGSRRLALLPPRQS